MNRRMRLARERHRMPGPFDCAKPEVIATFCATVRSVRLRKRLERMLAFLSGQPAEPRTRRTRRPR